MTADDFDYLLPDDLIAARPPERRDGARMMVIERAHGTITHAQFMDLPHYLRPQDVLVLNDTRVVPARFFLREGVGEILRVAVTGERLWECMVKPGKKFKPGRRFQIGECWAEVREVLGSGHRVIAFDERVPDPEEDGRLALPPYIDRPEETADRERYQTVFGCREGAIAAPTAGLHFTQEMLAGLPHAFVTLHVGVGTFLPVKAERLEEHRMHEEWFSLSPELVSQVAGKKIVAVGTTVVRVLETCALRGGLRPMEGTTDLFLKPGCQFHLVDRMLTNFHLPKSTLLMLVSAFAGTELIREAYAQAVRERYRFFSYGDCMLIL